MPSYYAEKKKLAREIDDLFKKVYSGEIEGINLSKLLYELNLNYALSKKVFVETINNAISLYDFMLRDNIISKKPGAT